MSQTTQINPWIPEITRKSCVTCSIHAQGKPAFGDIEVETIFDLEQNRYQIVHMGWQHDRRIHHCLMHMDIRNGKIWILHNTTEHELDLELLAIGVPTSDIVLGLHPPELRQFTGYAVQ